MLSVLAAAMVPVQASGKGETKALRTGDESAPAAPSIPPFGRGGKRIDQLPGHVLFPGLIKKPGGTGSASPSRPVKTGLFVPGAKLSGKDLSHKNLRKAPLAGADLSGANLRFADLTDADLTGANLSHADLTGATLTRAWVSLATVAGAKGLDLRDAERHGFFQGEPDDSLGCIKEYTLDDPSFQPQQIAVGSKGDIFLLEKGKSSLYAVAPTGGATHINLPLGGLTCMVKEGRHHLWVFGERGAALLKDDLLYAVTKGSRTFPLSGGSVLAAVAVAPGIVWSSMPGELTRHTYEARKLKGDSTPAEVNGFAFTSLTVSSDGQWLFGADPARDHLVALNPGKEVMTGVPVADGSRLGCLAQGHGGTIWYTAPGVQEIGFFTIGKESQDPIKVVQEFRVRGGVHAIAKGGDGFMWYTLDQAGAIGRTNEAGASERWSLDKGMIPGALAAGPDGNMYFTMIGNGRSAIGSIRTGSAAPAVTGGSSGSATASLAEPAKDGPSRSARREMAFQRELLAMKQAEAEASRRPGPQEESKQPESKEAKPVQAEPSRSAPPSSAPAERKSATPWDALRALDVRLSRRRLGHILDNHHFNVGTGKSEFIAEFSTADTLLPLLVQGLQCASAIGRVVKRYDAMGSRHTYCRMDKPVGYYMHWDEPVATPMFDVVTRPVRLKDGRVIQRVWSAYPENPKNF
jgi:streptogramin lyase